MRFVVTACAALAFAGVARAEEAPRTVSDYFLAMEASAGRLDLAVSERQKAGDMAAAQRLVLASAMVRRAAAEFRGAEQAALLEPVSSLPAPLPQRAAAALSKSGEAETEAADHAEFIASAQATFNALLAALPQNPAHPVFYGLLSADLAPLESDIVIYGFRLIDPLSKTAPAVLYGKTELGPSALAIGDDRIEVKLPDSVKQAVHFAPPPCEPRPSFGLRVRATYWEPHGLWPLRWTSEVQTGADLYALPTPSLYAAAVSASAETTSATSQRVTFRQRSSLAVADCGETRAAQVAAVLPEAAQEANCSAAWVDASGAARVAAHCGVEGHAARATGEIVGGTKVCSPDQLCTCLAQAQGFLEASGSYRIEQPAHQLVAVPDQAPVIFPAGGVGQGRVALEPNERLRHIAVTVTRRACPTPLDTLDLTAGDGAEAFAVSKSGGFRAVLRGTELTVGAAEALAPGARTP